MLNWVNRFNICVFLDNHHYVSSNHTIECLAAAGTIATLQLPAGNALEQLEHFHHEHKDWIFGHLAYDLKNEIETLHSSHPDGIGFPDLYFFVPEVVFQLTEKSLQIGVKDERHAIIFNEINYQFSDAVHKSEKIDIDQRFSREEYLQTIRSIQQHIHAGDCYELNFCQEFYVDKVRIDPVQTYQQLSENSPNPFSAFYKCEEKFVLCASPERYLQKKGKRILSQPIKGTRVRITLNNSSDEQGRIELAGSEKDRSENVMVVDLVRNDLAKVCEKGSIVVSELFGIYTFPQVHQMISSITGVVRSDAGIAEMIRSTFPMGSMTGAPKKSVMDLIERYERTKRGVFSGAIGYISPNGDFDFNVVIRSLLYNSSTGYLSFQAGSAITFYSVAEEEYEECLVKIAAIKKVLAAANTF